MYVVSINSIECIKRTQLKKFGLNIIDRKIKRDCPGEALSLLGA